MRVLITGGNGFLGSNFLIQHQENFEYIVNLDNLSYAANPNLNSFLEPKANYESIEGCITDETLVPKILEEFAIDCVINFAAETHVDRSIHSANKFVQTNVVGTYNLINHSNNYIKKFQKTDFRFLQISTDEVYGALEPDERPFSEKSPLAPNNPYSATKASSEMLCRSYHQTHNFPVIIVNCSNNYGPFQHWEKFIPTLIKNAIMVKPLPIYGKGLQIRDWLFVTDNCEAIFAILKNGSTGEKYNIGGATQITNIELAKTVCNILDEVYPKDVGHHSNQIKFITDRLGHDYRYEVDFSKTKKELGWTPTTSLEEGQRTTVVCFIENKKHHLKQ